MIFNEVQDACVPHDETRLARSDGAHAARDRLAGYNPCTAFGAAGLPEDTAKKAIGARDYAKTAALQDYVLRTEKRQKRAARMQKEAGDEDCKQKGLPRRSVACERYLKRQRDKLFKKQMDKWTSDKALNIFTAGA